MKSHTVAPKRWILGVAFATLLLVVGSATASSAYVWGNYQKRTGGVAYNGESGDCEFIYDVLLSSATTYGYAYTSTTSGCTAGEVRHYYFDTHGWAGLTSWKIGGSGSTSSTLRTHNVLYSEHQVDN